MTFNELQSELGIEKDKLEIAVTTNGFSIDSDIDARQKGLIVMYIDYLTAQEDAREARKAFKYLDGEESVDKSKVFDQYRRYAMDLYNAWNSAKRDYDEDMSGSGSYFTIRKRAGFLNARTR